LNRKTDNKKDIKNIKDNVDNRSTTLIKGVIESHASKNFAFFIPDDKDMKDAFIHSKNLNGATDKDRVAVELATYRGRLEAKVRKIIEKGITTVVGVYSKVDRRSIITPIARSFQYNIDIKDPANKYIDGDILVVKITKYPDTSGIAYGDVLHAIGNINDQGIDNKIVIAKHNIITRFPDDVNSEAEMLPSKSFKNEKDITDFSKLYTVTIDGDSAKDFDDAISIEEMDNGTYILYVHIADVSRYVTKDSIIDEYAKGRGTSIYFPQFAVPMLPEILSNDLCSLIPHVVRRTVTAKITTSSDGKILSTEFFRSKIESNQRLTYNFVNDIISSKQITEDRELINFIDRLNKLYTIFDKKNLSKDYISFDFPESIFTFNNDGSIKDIILSNRGVSERAIEYFMITANEAVASFLATNNKATIYRVHDKPDALKVKDWINTAKGLGLELSLPEEITVKTISQYSIAASKSKYSSILLPLLVRSMMRAEYSIDNIGHFGLGSTFYTHFTSPIRRYPDLLVHRALLNQLGFIADSEDINELQTLAKTTTELEKRAAVIESDITTFKKLEYLSLHKDDDFVATINRISNSGLRIFLDKILFVSSIDFNDIHFDIFRVDGNKAVGERHNKQFSLGDTILIKLVSIDITTLSAKFSLKDDIDNSPVVKKQKHKKIDDSRKNKRNRFRNK